MMLALIYHFIVIGSLSSKPKVGTQRGPQSWTPLLLRGQQPPHWKPGVLLHFTLCKVAENHLVSPKCNLRISRKTKTAAGVDGQPRGHLAEVNPPETSPQLTCCLYLSARSVAPARSDPSCTKRVGIGSGSPGVLGDPGVTR